MEPFITAITTVSNNRIVKLKNGIIIYVFYKIAIFPLKIFLITVNLVGEKMAIVIVYRGKYISFRLTTTYNLWLAIIDEYFLEINDFVSKCRIL